MSNAPPTWELLIVPDGMKKVSMEMETKIPNAATFKILKEDHTLGNALRMQLLKNKKVIFAGYKMPHPLEHEIIIKIQTTPDSTPIAALETAIKELINEYDVMRNRFENQLTLHAMHETTAMPTGQASYQEHDF